MPKFRNTGSIFKFAGVVFLGLIGAFSLVFIGDLDFSGSSGAETETESQFEDRYPAEYWTVTEIKDGDTFVVKQGFKTETVRLIGIDTPELGDCYYNEASARMRQLVYGEDIELRFDDSQGERDRYDRLLSYAYLSDGTFVNQEMILGGYAREYTYSGGYEQMEKLRLAEEEARRNKAGLWAMDTCAGLDNGPDSGIVDPTCRIKGNISSDGARNYHLEGCRDYDKTNIDIANGEQWFCSELEAVEAGWRRARSCSI